MSSHQNTKKERLERTIKRSETIAKFLLIAGIALLLAAILNVVIG